MVVVLVGLCGDGGGGWVFLVMVAVMVTAVVRVDVCDQKVII